MIIKVRRIISVLILSALCVGITGCSSKSKEYYEEAKNYYEQSDYNAASESFKQAIQLKEDDADYYIDYGYCLIKLGEYEAAQQSFEQAILKKDNKVTKKSNKKAYRGLGILFYIQGDYESAITYFNKALKLSSLKEFDTDILSYVGSATLELGKNEEAIETFLQVIDEDKENVSALKSLGYAYYLIGNYEKSLESYDKALKLVKDDYEIYFGKYDVLMAQGKDSDAKEVINQATLLEIKDEEDKFYLAKLQYYLGNESQAMSGFSIAAENGFYKGYQYIGNIYFDQEDYENAISYYERYVDNMTEAIKDADFYNRLGVSYLNQQEYDFALDAIMKGIACANATQKQSLLRNEIIVYEHLGDYKTALTKMEDYLANYEDEDANRDYEFIKTRQ